MDAKMTEKEEYDAFHFGLPLRSDALSIKQRRQVD